MIEIFATMALQIGSGLYNTYKQGKNMDKIQALQREFEETMQAKGIEQAWDKFDRLRDFQKQMDRENHEYRLINLEDGLKNNLDRVAYMATLNKWPLYVLPFIMKGEALYPATENAQAKIPLHCLLAPFNDSGYNKNIYKEMEHTLFRYFNRHWNAGSSHPILFYEGAWKNVNDRVIPDNLKTELKTLPTLLVTPIIKENGGIEFRISAWGIPGLETFEDSTFIPTKISYDYRREKIHTPEERQQILDELCPALQAFVGYIADQYYWAYDKVPPLLPSLLAKGEIAIGDDKALEEYKEQYLAMFDRYVVEDNEVNRLNMLVVPEKSLELVEGIKEIISSDELKEMLDGSLETLCKSRNTNISNSRVSDLLSLNVYNKNDVKYLTLFKKLYDKDDFENIISEKIEEINNLKFDDGEITCDIKKQDSVSFNHISVWVSQNRQYAPNASEAVVSLRKNNAIMVAFVDESGQIIHNQDLGVLLLITPKFNITGEVIIDDDLIEWNFYKNIFISNKKNFMTKENFHSFERLGKQLDELVNNVQRSVRPRQRSSSRERQEQQGETSNDFLEQLVEYFTTTTSSLLDAESVNVLTFVSIKNWLESKLPVPRATKLFVIKTEYKQGLMFCLFFGKEQDALLGELPMKRIYCNGIDEELQEAINGLSVFTIKI